MRICSNVETYTHFKMWAFAFLTVALTFGLLGVGAYQKRAEVAANWSKYRHDPLYLFFAYWFKPDEDPRTRLEFATDTFKDEVMYILDGIFATMLAPIFQIFKLFTDALTQTGSGLFTIKALFAKLFEKWNQMKDIFVRRFNGLAHQSRMTFIKLYSAFERVFGVAVSSIYTGLATIMTIASFIELVITIMIIICAIIAAMMIFLFFILWPIMPIFAIGLTIVGIAAGAAAGAGGAALSSFCFAEETLIQTISGPIPIKDITIGTTLSDGAKVTGTMILESVNTPIYNLYGVRVSGNHIVYDNELGPIHVEDHPDAKLLVEKVPFTYCLITSNRKVPVLLPNNTIQVFADWEELSDTEDLIAWHRQVHETLNKSMNAYITPSKESLASEAVFTGNTKIWTLTGPANIRGIRPGDSVMDMSGNPTRVTGVVKVDGSEVHAAIPLGGNAYASASVWIQDSTNKWSQPPLCTIHHENCWYSLFTESGSFALFQENYPGMTVRDFSDIGVNRIDETYDWVLNSLKSAVCEENLDEQ
jgi:hypothetical protein